VNPGNSGGPLFNINGEVVGINSQIYSQSGGYMGLSFAIPIDIANNVREQLIKTGHVSRGRIGVHIQPVDQRLADSFGLDRPRGALVAKLEPDSPGAKAGIKVGDVITKVGLKTIELYGEVPSVVSQLKPGTEADIEVWRECSPKRISVKVAEAKEADDGEGAAVSRKDAEPGSTGKLGLAVRPLSSEERREAETEGSLLVEDVDGPAEAAGVRPGDIILAVNGTAVKNVSELQAAAKKAGRNVALLVLREGDQTFLALRVDQ
jgi:serine protease Do